jgi:diguanylate cyclase (GGDEF)-like protein/PAS domain S-box-containing protein
MEMMRESPFEGSTAQGMPLCRIHGAAVEPLSARQTPLRAVWNRLPVLKCGLFGALPGLLLLGTAGRSTHPSTAYGLLLVLAILFATGVVAAVQLREHRQLVARLRESEARYRVLAEGSSDAVLLIGRDGICRHVSPSIETLLGYAPEAVLGRRVDVRIHPGDRQAARQAALAALAGVEAPNTVELRFRDRAGQWRWLEARLRPLHKRQPVGVACAIRDISERRAREALLERRASIDALTGLLNRDCLMRELEAATAAARSGGEPFALVLFDIDHFKRINDAHGHPTGDRVLEAIGAACEHVVRTSDAAGRLGGEEFAILLRGAAIAAATDVCMRLRQRIESCAALDPAGRPIVAKISAGIACYRPDAPLKALIASADRALYAAKHGGRDCAYAAIEDRLIRAL